MVSNLPKNSSSFLGNYKGGLPQELVEYEKARDRSVISVILSGIDEKLRPQYDPNGGRIFFEEIMQATVGLRKLSEDEKSPKGLKLIADMETEVGKAKGRQLELMKAGVPVHSGVAEDLILMASLAIKTYKENSEVTSSSLKGKALKVAYLQRLKEVSFRKLAEQLQSNGCISNQEFIKYLFEIPYQLRKKPPNKQEKKLKELINSAKNKERAKQCLNNFKDRHSIIEGIEQAITGYDLARIQVYQHNFLFPSMPDTNTQEASNSSLDPQSRFFR